MSAIPFPRGGAGPEAAVPDGKKIDKKKSSAVATDNTVRSIHICLYS